MSIEKICGIYRIENLINHKSYIGQAVDIYKRWTMHKWELNSGKHHNIHLLRAWKKYGEYNFEFSIIEECDEKNLNEREMYWVEYYDAFYNGYNQTKGGDGCLGKTWTEEERERNSRPVLQIDLNGNVVHQFININDAWEQTGINRRQIWNCANKVVTKMHRNDKIYKHTNKTAGGYIWIYADELDLFDLSYYISNVVRREVYQYDVYWNLIKKWDSAESTKECGYDPSTIRSVCNGDYMTAYDCLWSYDVDNLDEYILWYKAHFDIKYIGQYDLKGNLVHVWNTASETKQDGFNPILVREVLRGKYLKHKKYVFKYISWKDLENNWKGQLKYGKQRNN